MSNSQEASSAARPSLPLEPLIEISQAVLPILPAVTGASNAPMASNATNSTSTVTTTPGSTPPNVVSASTSTASVSGQAKGSEAVEIATAVSISYYLVWDAIYLCVSRKTSVVLLSGFRSSVFVLVRFG